MRLDDHFGSGSTLQRNERVKLAASFWNNAGAGIGGLVFGWFCYSVASNILTYLHTLPEERR